MGDRSTLLSAAEARHLLRRSGFGAPRDDVARIVGRPRGEAVDAIVGFTTRNFLPLGRTTQARRWSWVRYMLRTPTPLQEKLVLFWHDHFATGDSKVDNPRLMGRQNALLRRHCKGDFRVLLKAINQDAAMMEYLDTVRNDKLQPNENYARELLELFAVGVQDAAGHATYTQADVLQIARAFSGWSYDPYGRAEFDRDGSRHDYMAEFPERGAKIVFTSLGGFGSGGRNLAEHGEGAPEIDTVVDIVLDHRDSDGHKTAARFIAAKLIAYFALPEPKRMLTAAVLSFADAIIAESRFDETWSTEALLRALFAHDAFYETAVAAPFPPQSRKSVRWPSDFAITTLRLLRVRLSRRFARVAGGDYASIEHHLRNMGQHLLDPPSVFGWDWENAWLSSAALMARYRFVRDVTAAHGESSMYFRPQLLLDVELSEPAAILEAVLEILGVPDQFSDSERNILLSYLTDGGTVATLDLNNPAVRGNKLHGLFALVLQSPACQLC